MRKFVTGLIALAVLFGIAAIIFIYVRSVDARQRRFLADVCREHPGRMAWHDGRTVYVIDTAHLADAAHARQYDMPLPCKRIRWSRDGATLYVVLDEGSAFDTLHRIDALDVATGSLRTVLSLKEAKLEDDDLDTDNVWVSEWAEAEAAEERIVFRLKKKIWYSVEAKRPRVRPEGGAPARPWDQTVCSCGKHRLERESGDDDDWLELTDGETTVTVTGTDVNDDGAWWCAPK